MEEMVFQIGPIRPPSEANSLLLRVTVNCLGIDVNSVCCIKNTIFIPVPLRR